MRLNIRILVNGGDTGVYFRGKRGTPNNVQARKAHMFGTTTSFTQRSKYCSNTNENRSKAVALTFVYIIIMMHVVFVSCVLASCVPFSMSLEP